MLRKIKPEQKQDETAEKFCKHMKISTFQTKTLLKQGK